MKKNQPAHAAAGPDAAPADTAQPQATRKVAPAYEQIKQYVLERVANGTWKPGEMIPSDTELVKEFGVARMTVSRALRELTAERVLTRVQGSGTFVAPRDIESTGLEIRNIAEEIAPPGHRHSGRVLTPD